LNTGATKFIDATPALSMPYSGIVSFRAADLDQDGLTDIAFLDYTGKVILAKNLRPYQVQINNGPSTSVSEQSTVYSPAFDIYPNPVTDRLMIRFQKPGGIYQLRLMNMNGQVMWEKTYDAGSEKVISTEELSAGIYLLHVIKDHKVIGTQKVVK